MYTLFSKGYDFKLASLLVENRIRFKDPKLNGALDILKAQYEEHVAFSKKNVFARYVALTSEFDDDTSVMNKTLMEMILDSSDAFTAMTEETKDFKILKIPVLGNVVTAVAKSPENPPKAAAEEISMRLSGFTDYCDDIILTEYYTFFPFEKLETYNRKSALGDDYELGIFVAFVPGLGANIRSEYHIAGRSTRPFKTRHMAYADEANRVFWALSDDEKHKTETDDIVDLSDFASLVSDVNGYFDTKSNVLV